MCGICGIFEFGARPVTELALAGMLDAMRYRGPDDDGTYIHGNVGLGNVRLAIVDLSAGGHMPMRSEDDRYVITYNGEVYNAPELREELEGQFIFRSRSDTEVVLNAYRRWGPGCLERFNGMFAFAIYDKVDDRLFAARDRFGIKPFYYHLDDKRFIFASEIVPLFDQVSAAPAPDDETVFDFLLFNRTNHTERTFFERVRKLQHGHSVTVDRRGVRFNRWYELKPGTAVRDPDELRERLAESIDLQLRSDVPVGACLSGGLDSACIVWLMSPEYRDRHLSTFSAVYGEGVDGDESPYIAANAEGLARTYFTRPSAASLVADLDAFVRAQGEPTYSSSAYAEFKVMELASRHVTVVLSGQGVDEALGGYPYLFAFLFKELLFDGALGAFARESWQYVRKHQSTYALAALVYLLLPARLRTRLRVAGHACLTHDFARRRQVQRVIPEKLYASNTLGQAALDHFEFKMEHHLMWGDRSSMWQGVEMRFPFLDHRLIESLVGLDREHVIHDGMTKRILRDAVRGRIPEVVRSRVKKIGFETPENDWLRAPALRQVAEDTLASSSFKTRGYIDAAKARELYTDHLQGRRQIGKEVWKWISLELWCRKFIDSPRAGAFASVGATSARQRQIAVR